MPSPLAGARRMFAIGVLALSLIALPAVAHAGDPVVEWNGVAVRVTLAFVANGRTLFPVEQSRAMAIVHVAMHDAVNGITGTYQTYSATGAAPAGASPQAAAIAAAYHALKGQFGDAHFGNPTHLTTAYLASLDTHTVSLQDPGLGFGQSVAEAILTLRQGDGAASAAYPYLPPNAGQLGVWMPITNTPGAQAILPGWGQVTPWVLRSGAQFRPDPPPALDSEQYARDYIEVQQVGARASHMPANDQTESAQFWRASPVAIWSPILRTAIESRHFDLSTSAQVAALVNLAGADASIAVWEAKYVYNFWRPQPAIVNGDAVGNPLIIGDTEWVPLVATPAHPEYPSGHTANSGAMAYVLREIFGDAPGYLIEATSTQTPGVVRYWTTFTQGVQEVIDARVYSGIHFRTADVVGARQGRQVAQFVLKHALRPATPR